MDLPDGVSNVQEFYWSLIVSELNKTAGPVSARVSEEAIESFSASHVSLNLVVSAQNGEWSSYLGFVRSFTPDQLKVLSHQIGLRFDYLSGRNITFDYVRLGCSGAVNPEELKSAELGSDLSILLG